MSFAPIAISPVWFSTDRQLAALAHSWQTATWITRLLGTFETPADCASFRGILTPWMRVPTGLQAEGRLSLTGVTLSFQQTPYRIFGWRFQSPLQDLSIELSQNDVLAIEPVDFRSPVMSTFDLPYTRLRTSKPAPIDNFLLCVGGRISMPRIRARSQELRQQLLSWQTDA